MAADHEVRAARSPRSVFGKFDHTFVILRLVWLVLVFFRPTIVYEPFYATMYQIYGQYLTFPGPL